jgi:hypothetical protein
MGSSPVLPWLVDLLQPCDRADCINYKEDVPRGAKGQATEMVQSYYRSPFQRKGQGRMLLNVLNVAYEDRLPALM